MLLSSYKRLSYKNIELMRMDKFMSWMSCQLVLSRLLQPTCVPNHSDFLLGFIGYTCLSACCFYWLSRVTTRNTSESAIPGRYSMVRYFQICSYRLISIFFGCFQLEKTWNMSTPFQTSEIQAPSKIFHIPAFPPGLWYRNFLKNLNFSQLHLPSSCLLTLPMV